MNQAHLIELFNYDRRGFFVRKMRTGLTTFIGQKVKGSLHHTGYLFIKIDNKTYLFHRMVFLFKKGYLPKYIDHKDRVKSNCKIGNLRKATASFNSHNTGKSKSNTSGFAGVNWEPKDKKWSSRIQIRGVRKRLGYFASAIEASAVYEREKAKILRRK